MSKKSIFISIIIFLVGILFGGALGSNYSLYLLNRAKDSANMMQIMTLQSHADWGDRSYQAYSQESPDIAIWSLKNYIEVLERHKDLLKSVVHEKSDSLSFQQDLKGVRCDLRLAYARLALKYLEIQKPSKYKEAISKSIEISKEGYNGNDIITEDDILGFVNRLDKTKN